jgi:hypothetical protein
MESKNDTEHNRRSTKFAAHTTEVKTAQTMKNPKPNSREKAAPKKAALKAATERRSPFPKDAFQVHHMPLAIGWLHELLSTLQRD